MLVSAQLKWGFWWIDEIGYLLLKIVTNSYKIVVINIVVSTGLQKSNAGFRPKNIRIVSEPRKCWFWDHIYKLFVFEQIPELAI